MKKLVTVASLAFVLLILSFSFISSATTDPPAHSCWTTFDHYSELVNKYNADDDIDKKTTTREQYIKDKWKEENWIKDYGDYAGYPDERTSTFTGALSKTLAESGVPAWFTKRLATWESGFYGGDGINDIFVKYLLLFLIILLIYSALAYVNFPDSSNSSTGSIFIRVLLSVIGGFLATFAITTSDVVAILQSYSALGITLSLFFPIMVLVFFTMVVASKGSGIGIFSSRIMWVIYSAYLFIKSGVLLLINNGWVPGRSFIVCFFLGNSGYQNVVGSVRPDPITTTVMFIASIFVFFIFVLGHKTVEKWFSQQKLESEVEARKLMLDRALAKEKLDAENLQKS